MNNPIKKLALLLAGAVMTLSVGCAAGIVGKIPEVEGDNYADVYIARKAGNNGCDSAFLIRLDDKDFIRLACGMFTHFKIPAGQRIKISSVSSMVSDVFYLRPQRGEIYYFAMDCNVACWFDRETKEDYETIATTCFQELAIGPPPLKPILQGPPTYHLVKHKPTGYLFVVRLRGDQIADAAGPLGIGSQPPNDLSSLAYNDWIGLFVRNNPDLFEQIQ